jgi:hypothetical protein
MITLVQKMQDVEAEIEAERGGIALFGLFEREDSTGRWDIVVAAAWAGQNEKQALDYVIGKIQPKLTLPELIAISHVAVLSPDVPFVHFIHSFVRVRQGLSQLADFDFEGMRISRAYVITSEPLVPAVPDVEAMQEETSQILESMRPRDPPAASAPVGPRTSIRSRGR